MLPHLPPPPAHVLQVQADLPLLPGSDPIILSAFRWTLAHSASLRDLLPKIASAEPRARYRLLPGFEQNYGKLIVHPTADAYDVDVLVPILPWRQCGDALEPWIAGALYLAWYAAGDGHLRGTTSRDHLAFLPRTRKAAFAFQAQVRKELVAADPERLKDLPDALELYLTGFRPPLRPTPYGRVPVRPEPRPLAGGIGNR